jgi:hypothetical protein
LYHLLYFTLFNFLLISRLLWSNGLICPPPSSSPKPIPEEVAKKNTKKDDGGWGSDEKDKEDKGENRRRLIFLCPAPCCCCCCRSPSPCSRFLCYLLFLLLCYRFFFFKMKRFFASRFATKTHQMRRWQVPCARASLILIFFFSVTNHALGVIPRSGGKWGAGGNQAKPFSFFFFAG